MRKKEFAIAIFLLIILYVLDNVSQFDLSIIRYVVAGIIICIFLFCFFPQTIKYIKKRKVWNLEKEEISHLQALCEDLCLNVNKDLKKKRIQIKIISIIVILLVFFAPIVMFLPNKLTETMYIYMGFAYIIISLIFLVLGNNTKKKYENLYKQEVIHKFIKSVRNDFTYSNDLTLNSDMKFMYMNSNFEKASYSKHQIDIGDCISGNIKPNVYMKMGDVFSYLRGGSSNEYDPYDSRYTLFRGNFMILDISKTFEESKIIRNKINIFDKKELIETENELFNKYFEIHAQNKESINYLSPYLIQFIADFREKYQIDFEIIFKDKIYIRFFTGNMFEPKIFGKIVDKYSIYKYYVITKFAEELVEKLNNM